MELRNKLRIRSLSTLLFASSVAATILLACSSDSHNFVVGEVIQERGNVAALVEFDDTLENPYYVLKVDTEQGVYIFEVHEVDGIENEGCYLDYVIGTGMPCNFGSRVAKSVYTLAIAIEEGTRVRFPTELLVEFDDTFDIYSLFSSDRIGLVDPDNIEILNQ